MLPRPLSKHNFRPNVCRGRHGFSLVEMTVVLLVMSVVLAGVLPLLAERTDSQASDVTEERIKVIEGALASFKEANKRLPCPANNTAPVTHPRFGDEVNRGTSPYCNFVIPVSGSFPALGASATNGADTDTTVNPMGAVAVGGVPVRVLGLSDEYVFDGWGRRFSYYVEARLTQNNAMDGVDDAVGPPVNVEPVAPYLEILTTGGGTVRTNEAIYAITSHGPSGDGAYLRSGQRNEAGASFHADEGENLDINAHIVQRSLTMNATAGTRYDDRTDFRTKETINLGSNAGGSVEPVGADGDVQFKDGSSFGGEAAFHWDTTNKLLSVQGTSLGSLALSVEGTSQFTGYSPSGTIQIETDVANEDGKIAFGRVGPTIDGQVGAVGDLTLPDRLSDFATTGDFVLQANAADLILTTRNGSGAIRFGTGATDTEKVTITNGGNVGIGTDSPTSRFQILNEGGADLADDVAIYTTASSLVGPGFLGYRARGTEAARSAILANDPIVSLTGKGYTGSGYLDAGNIMVLAETNFATSTSAYLQFNTHNGTTYGERMRITGAGNVLIPGAVRIGAAGTPQDTLHIRSKLRIDGQDAVSEGGQISLMDAVGTGGWEIDNQGTDGNEVLRFFRDRGEANSFAVTVNNAAQITAAGFIYSSDRSLKKDIDPVAEEMLSAILAVEPVRYRYQTDAADAPKRLGVIAQQVQHYFPELVKTDDKGHLGVDYPALTVPLLKAVQELAAAQKALEARVAVLEGAATVADAVQPKAALAPALSRTAGEGEAKSVAAQGSETTLSLTQALLLLLGVSTLQTLLFLAISRQRK